MLAHPDEPNYKFDVEEIDEDISSNSVASVVISESYDTRKYEPLSHLLLKIIQPIIADKK